MSKSFENGVCNGAKVNDQMQEILAAVRIEINSALDDMQRLERWVQLLVPKIEDGNNFGVDVQRYVITQISASKVALQTAWDGLTDYSWQRATAFEKFAHKVTTDKTKTSTSTKATGGKDGDENKTSVTETEKHTETAATAINDFLAYVVAIDVKWYFNLLRTTENIRDHYSFALDLTEKNLKKLRLPRGTQDRGGMNMF